MQTSTNSVAETMGRAWRSCALKRLETAATQPYVQHLCDSNEWDVDEALVIDLDTTPYSAEVRKRAELDCDSIPECDNDDLLVGENDPDYRVVVATVGEYANAWSIPAAKPEPGPAPEWLIQLRSALGLIQSQINLGRPPTPDEALQLTRLVQSPSDLRDDRPDLARICQGLAGHYKRIQTYCEPIDENTGGGIQTDRIIVIGAGPGCAKTSLCVAMGYEIAQRGAIVKDQHREVVVDFIATDEPRAGCLSRIGQIEGIPRPVLEDEDVRISGPAWQKVADHMSCVPTFTLWDPRLDGTVVDTIVERGAKRAANMGGRYLFIIDSLQTAPFLCDGLTGEKSIREQIDARMKTIRNLCLRYNACAIVISELNRSGTRMGLDADITAFKESGAIEYGVDIGILLARVKKEPGFVVDGHMLKNRLGESPVRFRLERTNRLGFRSVPLPDEEEIAERKEAGKRAELSKVDEKVFGVVLASPGLGVRQLRAKAAPMRNTDVDNAIERLIDAGRVTRAGSRSQGYKFFASSSVPSSEEDEDDDE